MHQIDVELWGRLEGQSGFQSAQFVQALFDNVAPAHGAKPVIIVVRTAEGEPAALFVFAERRRWGLRVLESLDFDVTDYFAPPVATAFATDAALIWEAAMRALPRTDAVRIGKVPAVIYGTPHALSGASFLAPTDLKAYTVCLKHPDGTSLDPTTVSAAKDVRRKERKLSALGTVTFSEAKTSAQISEAIDQLIVFRLQRFSELGRADLLDRPEYQAFYRQLASQPRSIVRVFALCVDEETIAVVYTLSWNGALTLLIPAISSDPKWTPGSPGLVSIYKTLEWASENDYRTFDLSIGAANYKTRFNADELELYQYQMPLTPAGAVLLKAEAVATATRQWLNASRLGPPLKRLKATLGR